MPVKKKTPKKKLAVSNATKTRKAASKAIVVIGASAGGLDAVSELIKNLPSDTGMSFFYIQHLSPTHVSQLGTLLSRSTKMKVKEVDNLKLIEPNCLYVCVPNKEMQLRNGRVHLSQRSADKLPYLPIDDFFKSVAKAYGKRAVGVILSGNATDGTLGLKAIKRAGGLTFAQDNSAKYESMPRSAIEAGVADHVLPPAKIATELVLLSSGATKQSLVSINKRESENITNADFKAILEILYKTTGNDFAHYKVSTIRRRLNYRMQHCGVKTLKQYTAHLQKSDIEARLLQKDLLINVTSFFRDESAFRYLKSKILPELLSRRAGNDPVRIWVPGCSTGEEAYSIAILIAEIFEATGNKARVQIFATDLSVQAVKEARIGEYTEKDIAAVSRARLTRFFVKTGKNYRINKTLREWCVFAPHNVLDDPPFSRLDLICCCNLLIYLDSAAQKRVFSTFNFALKDSGYLMLGKSETIGNPSLFYSPVNGNLKIYAKKNATRALHVPLLYTTDLKRRNSKIKRLSIGADSGSINRNVGLDVLIDSVLLSHYMPACAIINKEMNILKFRGSTAAFLSHSSGDATLNILKMAPPEFTLELRAAINRALKTREVVSCHGIDLEVNGAAKTMSLEVHPVKTGDDEPLLLIVFSAVKDFQNSENKNNHVNVASNGHVDAHTLKAKLAKTRTEMRDIIQAHETAYEALQIANEEIVSTNEEFQTLNEELETSKEEIEATNEELLSTNQELMMRNDLLNESYKYSEAIIATVHEPMLVLDSNLHIRSANNSFYRKFLVSKEETIGASVFDLGNRQWSIPKLRKLLTEILLQNISFKNLEITHTFEALGTRIMQLNAHQIIQKTHKEKLILLAIEDITERARHFLREKENLKRDIDGHKAEKQKLEAAVKLRTRELEEKNLELETANKDLTSFTYVSSHDLQEPLRKIRNFAAVLMEEEQPRLSSDGRRYLERTYETAKRMQALIEDLLMYSRAKNTERKFEKTSLSKIVGEVKKDLEEVIKDKKAVIRAKNIGDVVVIPSQFKQLFQNLISNAIKYSKPEVAPVIKIKSSIIQSSKIKNLNLNHKIEYCHISVVDNGIGFDPQYSERIFEVFQRLHSPDKFAGTGMGLAICKRIIENHDGIIRATGVLNQGSSFDIYIPSFRVSV